MKGQCRHNCLKGRKFLGDACLKDYKLLELGNFPAAVPQKDFSVFGEVYEIDEKLKKKIDVIEDEGILYRYRTVQVLMENGKTEDVGFYEYIHSDRNYKTRKPEGKWTPVRQDID